MDIPMTSSRPYLIRAIYEWLLDNNLTPYLLVDATVEGVVVPRQFVENGKIVLNITPHAVQGLELGDSEVCFSARFSGQAMLVSVPVAAALALYARENGRGMVFAEEPESPEPPRPDTVKRADNGQTAKKGAKPKLALIKS